MTYYEIEETLRRALVPERVMNVGDVIDYHFAPDAKETLVDLLHVLERERLAGVDSRGARP
jgi:hypothetical protein